MNAITVLFTRRKWNLISWLIRWTVPRSRFALALSSHCIVVHGNTAYEATMLYGVRQVPLDMALKGQTIVKETHYQVPNAYAGIEFARGEVGASYDWGGAIGVGLAPDRDWADPSSWYCYEFAAAVLRAAGRPVFADLSHVGEVALMAINP